MAHPAWRAGCAAIWRHGITLLRGHHRMRLIVWTCGCCLPSPVFEQAGKVGEQAPDLIHILTHLTSKRSECMALRRFSLSERRRERDHLGSHALDVLRAREVGQGVAHGLDILLERRLLGSQRF